MDLQTVILTIGFPTPTVLTFPEEKTDQIRDLFPLNETKNFQRESFNFRVRDLQLHGSKVRKVLDLSRLDTPTRYPSTEHHRSYQEEWRPENLNLFSQVTLLVVTMSKGTHRDVSDRDPLYALGSSILTDTLNTFFSSEPVLNDTFEKV